MKMTQIIGYLGCLTFLLVLAFWRINRYERQVLIYHKRMNRLLNAVVSTLPEDKREAFLKDNGIDLEKWKEPLRV